jgi:hypothetical protein
LQRFEDPAEQELMKEELDDSCLYEPDDSFYERGWKSRGVSSSRMREFNPHQDARSPPSAIKHMAKENHPPRINGVGISRAGMSAKIAQLKKDIEETEVKLRQEMESEQMSPRFNEISNALVSRKKKAATSEKERKTKEVPKRNPKDRQYYDQLINSLREKSRSPEHSKSRFVSKSPKTMEIVEQNALHAGIKNLYLDFDEKDIPVEYKLMIRDLERKVARSFFFAAKHRSFRC